MKSPGVLISGFLFSAFIILWLLVLSVFVYLGVLAVASLRETVDMLEHPAPVVTDTARPVKPGRFPTSPDRSHTEAIRKIERTSGLEFSVVAKRIIGDEGHRRVPYLDSQGQVTIGDGRNLSGNGITLSELEAIQPDLDYKDLLRRGEFTGGRLRFKTLEHAKAVMTKELTDSDIELLLVDDLKNVASEARQVFPAVWDKLNMVRKLAIIDTLYNLGLPHFLTFHNFIAAVKRQDWKVAASELLLSEAARVNIVRYHENAIRIQTGQDPR